MNSNTDTQVTTNNEKKKRHRRTNAELAELRDQFFDLFNKRIPFDIIKETLKIPNRCYEKFMEEAVDKTINFVKQDYFIVEGTDSLEKISKKCNIEMRKFKDKKTLFKITPDSNGFIVEPFTFSQDESRDK